MKNSQIFATLLITAFVSTSALSSGYVTDSSGNNVRTSSGCLYFGNSSDVTASCDGTMAVKNEMASKPMATKKPMMADSSSVSAPEPVVKNIINLDGVTFKTGSNELTGTSLNTLDSVAQQLKAKPDTKIIVAGHTDNTGDALKNLELSQARAEAVREHLVGQGVSADQLVAKGYGDTQSVATNDTSAGRAQNRRVELRLLK